PNISDTILDQISDHPIFSSTSHNYQLPISIQLVIFLNCAGHYRNRFSPGPIAQWAVVSVDSVINCTHCTATIAVLDQHNDFIQFPALDPHTINMNKYNIWVICQLRVRIVQLVTLTTPLNMDDIVKLAQPLYRNACNST
ncbi:hypothetical protein PAXRUDRAFT_136825, partial [Paxillus rubicundulus Ve08.2h10]